MQLPGKQQQFCVLPSDSHHVVFTYAAAAAAAAAAAGYAINTTLDSLPDRLQAVEEDVLAVA